MYNQLLPQIDEYFILFIYYYYTILNCHRDLQSHLCEPL